MRGSVDTKGGEAMNPLAKFALALWRSFLRARLRAELPPEAGESWPPSSEAERTGYRRTHRPLERTSRIALFESNDSEFQALIGVL